MHGILVMLWGKEDIQDKYVEVLLNICILGSHLFSCLANMKADSNLVKVKQFLVDVLKKTILPSKSKVSASSVAEMSPFLRLLTHREMASLLVSVMTKAMLRSPEVALSTVRMPDMVSHSRP